MEIPARKGQFMNVWQKVVETNNPPQPHGITVETRMKTPMRILLSLAGGVHPRNHQLRGRQLRDIYKENSLTYNAHDDCKGLVQGGVPGMLALVCSLDEVTQGPMAAMTQKKAS